MRRGRFCPKCGKEVDGLYNGLCDGCFTDKFDLSEKLPEKMVLGTCKMCGNIFLKEEKFESTEAATEKFLRDLLKQKEIKTASYRVHGTVLKLTLEIEFGDIVKELQREIFVVSKSITCKYCSMQKASYYNMTIQVRVPKEMQDKIVKEIEDELLRLSKKDGYSFISGMEELKEGVNLLVGSKGAAERAVNMIKDKYGATTKFSRKLYGLVEGKKTYRDTILVSIKKSD